MKHSRIGYELSVMEDGLRGGFVVLHMGAWIQHAWKIIEAVPDKRIVYEWRYEGFPGDSVVTWEILETEQGTKLTFTHSGGETFPQDNPIFSRESCIAGWQYFLNQELPAFLKPAAS